MSDVNERERERIQTVLDLIHKSFSFLESFRMIEMDYSYGTTETNCPLDYYPFSDCQVGKAVNQNKKEKKVAVL